MAERTVGNDGNVSCFDDTSTLILLINV